MAGWVENIPMFFVGITIEIVFCFVTEILTLFLTIIVTVLIPVLLHTLGILMSSWISDERCSVGLFWTSCKQVIGDNENILKQNSQEIGWSVTALIVASTLSLGYGSHALYATMLKLKDRDSIKTCCSLVISGVLDLAACLLLRYSCGDSCNFGVSYYLTSVAGWMFVLAGTLLMTLFLYFDRIEKSKAKCD